MENNECTKEKNIRKESNKCMEYFKNENVEKMWPEFMHTYIKSSMHNDGTQK